MAGFGGSVKLTGESEYKKALQNIKTSLREVSSEMKLVSAQFQSSDKNTAALANRSAELSKKLATQKQAITDLKASYSQMAKQYDAQTKKTEELQKSYNAEKDKLDQIKATLGTSSQAYQDQAKVVDALEQELKQSTTAQDSMANSLSKMRIDINNAETSIVKTENSLETLNKQLEETDDDADQAGAGLDGLASDLNNANKPAKDLGKSLNDAGQDAKNAEGGFTVFKGALADLVANVLQNAINKMKELISQTIEVGANFESAMANVQAISGATDKDLELLTETAKKFGATTQFSASEAANALSYMALAGWDAETSTSALGGVLDLAAASGMDLASASDMVTDYLSAFGLEADQSANFADMLAYAQGNANTTAAGLGEAFKNCAANMSAAGQDVETTTSLLSMLANQGLKGSEAGTALAAVMRDLTSKMEDGKIMIGETAVTVQDANGNYRDLTDILLDVEKATNGMGNAQKATALQSTFTADSIKGLNLLLNAGVGSAADFEKELRNCSGTAGDMASVMNDNLNGDMKALNSQIEGVQIALYEKFAPALRSGIEVLSELVNGLSFLVDHSSEVIAAITGIAVAVGTYIAYTTALKVMEEGWAALTIVTKAQTVAQAALNAVMEANPIGIVIALVAGLVAAFVVLWNKSEGFRNFWIGLWDTIASAAEPVIKGIVDWFKSAWDNIVKAWNGAIKFFGTIWDGIKAIFAPVVEYYTLLFKAALDGIKLYWNTATNYFKLIWESIKTIFSVVSDVLSGDFKGAWDKIKGIVGQWGAFFKNTWDGIKAIFDPVVSYFRGKFNDAWNAVKTVFSPITTFFSNIWSKIKDTFSNLGTAISNAIGGAVKSGINGVISTIQNTINSGINLINGAIGLINKLPGVSVGKISTLSLPRLAKGGIVDSPTLAEIGENGREAIIPLENNKGWIKELAAELKSTMVVPLTEYAKESNTNNITYNMYTELVSAFKDALSQMKVELDDEELGNFVEKTVADAIYT